MLRRLSVRDFVIVESLELEFGEGLTVLTGETGAGKSILVDALQLALGGRGDPGSIRDGASRSEVAAEFDAPLSMAGWLDAHGFSPGHDDDPAQLLLRRTVDAQARSRAWINGSPATLTQLREAADALVDIHGQHAWQSLTRATAVRAILDAHAGFDAAPLAAAWSAWRAAAEALASARSRQGDVERERESLAWQLTEIDRLAPAEGEWAELDAEHQRLANAQTLIDAAATARSAVAGGDETGGGDVAARSAEQQVSTAIDALSQAVRFDARLDDTLATLRSAQASLGDAAHTLSSYLDRADLDPQRLSALDERLAAWHGLARRHRRPPDELPALALEWRAELAALEAAADLDGLARSEAAARARYDDEAARASAARGTAAPKLASAVTRQIRALGMDGGSFDVALETTGAPQSYGFESVEFRVAGHAGTAPRPLAKVASGGELSRIALSIAVVTGERSADAVAGSADVPGTLIFDEVDAGIGGAVAETVGRLMKRLGRGAQVLAVTHLPQVAACADRHLVVTKASVGGRTTSGVDVVDGEARVAEIARMLGGEKLSSTSLAHAQEMLATGAEVHSPARRKPTR